MKHYALFYEVVDRFVERRAAFRAEHLELVQDAHAGGSLVLAGALGDPPDGAFLVFRAASPEVVEDFARKDPYVVHGVVTRWSVRTWNVVVEPVH